ncbi:MAG: polyprenyl synthetase family protein [Kiritimatiellae bacterium]|nr:polyprenyl synthetase family protein [Kiritimatiellia bacterium]
MKDLVEKKLDELLLGERPAILCEAMRHAVMAGGKRIRPQICLASAMAVGGKMEDAIYPACAIEFLHCYTLVHDDLPCMDNDSLRRGKPTVWVKYGEANAVLAGDALQSLAYRTLSKSPRNVDRILLEFANCGIGVVQGQVEDLSGGDLDFIYRHKTADLFVASAATGALAAGGSEIDVGRLRSYAFNLGMAFQFRDDILDGDSGQSSEEAQNLVVAYTNKAISSLTGLAGDTSFLVSLAGGLAERNV